MAIPPERDRREASTYFRLQYKNAEKVISVPYESLTAFCGDQDASPVFIFSIGRAGATLMSKLLGLAPNAVSLSEPGIFADTWAARPRGS